MVFNTSEGVVEDDLRISRIDQMLEENLRQDVLPYHGCAEIGIIGWWRREVCEDFCCIVPISPRVSMLAFTSIFENLLDDSSLGEFEVNARELSAIGMSVNEWQLDGRTYTAARGLREIPSSASITVTLIPF